MRSIVYDTPINSSIAWDKIGRVGISGVVIQKNGEHLPGRYFVPSSAMEPMHPFCTVQWMICKYQDECFHVLRSGLKSAASSASYSHLHHLAVRDSTHRSPSGRHTKAIMTTAPTCRSLWISPNLELRLNTHSQ